jgi:alpha-glucan,water dikinase
MSEREMSQTQTIPTRSGFELVAETSKQGDQTEVAFRLPEGKRCLLHWGIRDRAVDQWRVPPESVWPPGTQRFGQNAVQTPLSRQNGQAGVVLHLPNNPDALSVEFVLFFPEEKRWDNNGGQNYRVVLAEEPAPDLRSILRAEFGEAEVAFEQVFELVGQGRLAAAVTKAPAAYRVNLASDVAGPLLLHWGLAQRSPQEWLVPPPMSLPPNTTLAGADAAQTAFAQVGGLNRLKLEFPEAEAPLGLQFVLRQAGDAGRWLKFRGGNFYVPIHTPSRKSGVELGAASGLAAELVRAETSHNSWTLMHRFNLCHNLLDQVRGDPDELATLYVWLRFSAIRQLTWQRNYNTKPRELAHAQERLTQKLASLYLAEAAGRPLLRLMLTTVGRGGEGQRIRDEILNIMHRHHVKEVSGHFLEEWHQKLHNNTTPDDVVICEAYLEFLRTNGNHDRFYQVLESSGVTRQRLESFERPIRSRPDFIPHLKDGLIHDFNNFLSILKAAHSGTDFETALNAARGRLDGGLQGLLDWLAGHRNAGPEGLVHLVNQVTEARRRLSRILQHGDGSRELLYLDLALEQLLRGAIERNIHLHIGGDGLAELIARVLENVTLSDEDPELGACSRHWQRLQNPPRFSPEWALHAKAVTDRIARGLSAWIDRVYHLLQPKAEYLGHGFQAEPWTISLFSEEVVRGSSLGFALSTLLRQVDPLLRQAAQLSAWQIISRGRGAGKVVIAESLRALQRAQFAEPVVVVADRVSGDEEIPENVTAVLAPDVTDIVSHVAVRARNGHVLFAACYDAELLTRLKSLRDRHVQVEVSAAGDVVLDETTNAATAERRTMPAEPLVLSRRRFTKFAITLDEFSAEVVGSKACHQAELRGKLPNWIALPASAALPFAVFEHVLGLQLNRDTARRHADLVRQAERGEPETLTALRDSVLALSAPQELRTELDAAMARAGLNAREDWARVWGRIKQVWASKWNERAFLSRKKLGLRHEDLFMAVLIQEVIPADYAFVIHTVNPSTGNRDELLAEVVLGLGETLVGNYPGRALSFVADKGTKRQTLHSYPSKSSALYGAGLIFRSDSNGEDLAGFAGAGLYDSVLLNDPRHALLDYAQEPLVWDKGFRENLIATITRIGVEIERLYGSAQDIEGAVAGGKYYVVQTRPQVG